MRNKILGYGLLPLLLAALIFVKSADAALELTKIPPMEKYVLLPTEGFNEVTRVMEEVPMGEQYLAYRIRMPKTWTRGETFAHESENTGSVSLDILGSIARFDGPPRVEAQSYFTLEALQLDYEISARSWFINFVLSNGYTIEGMKEVNDRELDARYIHVEDGQSFKVRMAARINGPRIIVARYFVPLEFYEEEKVMQEQVMQSFEMANTKVKQIETRKTFEFLDQSYFDYPVSWVVNKHNILSVERMKGEVFNFSESEELDGRIRVQVISRLLETSLADEIKQFQEDFSVKDYELGPLIRTHEFEHHDDMDFAKTEAYKLVPDRPTMIKYEFWASVLQNDDYYYIVSMLTPASDAEYFVWTKNVEAYRVVMKSLRRYE